jgi:structural maintenance of chromosome 4
VSFRIPPKVVSNFSSDRSPLSSLYRRQVLENFKSYGGERVIGPFHKSFSAVVGPNGSGKSNVIDALLFVFGKRAAQLRLKRVSELIHHSSNSGDAPSSAKVSVFFHEIIDSGEGDEDYEIVPDSEVVLTRIARRDNTSVYQWNGTTKPLSEIAKYLITKGVDLQHNRFLILQGEVEQISLMAPKAKDENSSGGLLEYLEDMIGSHQYVPATEEAAGKVEECSQQRQEALGRLQAVSREKEGLQSAQQEALALLHAEQQLRAAQHLFAQLQRFGHLQNAESHQKDQAKVAEKLEETRAQLSEADEQLAGYQTQREEQKTAYDVLYQELVTTRDEFQAFERRDIKLRADCQHAKKQVQKSTKQGQQAAQQYEIAKQAVATAQEDLPVLEEERETLLEKQTSESVALEELFQARQEETQALRADLEGVTTKLAPLVEARSTAAAQLTTAQTAVQLVTSKAQQATKQCDAAKTELAQLDQHQQEQQDLLAKVQKDLEEFVSRRQELQEEDKMLVDKESKVARKHQTLVVCRLDLLYRVKMLFHG